MQIIKSLNVKGFESKMNFIKKKYVSFNMVINEVWLQRCICCVTVIVRPLS